MPIPEKVCLIQISTAAGDRLIDPLAGLNLDPFLDALNAHELIMHGGGLRFAPAAQAP